MLTFSRNVYLQLGENRTVRQLWLFLFARMIVLFMPSLHDAAEAVKYAQGIREDLSIRILQPQEDTGQDIFGIFNW